MWKREYWNLKAMKQMKQRYREQMERVKELPADYQAAFKEISTYLNSTYGGFDGLDLLEAQYNLVDIFAEMAERGIPAVDFIGPDVHEFAKNYGEVEEVPTWLAKYKEKQLTKINRKVYRKLGQKGDLHD